jgi:hypothetical protein
MINSDDQDKSDHRNDDEFDQEQDGEQEDEDIDNLEDNEKAILWQYLHEEYKNNPD